MDLSALIGILLFLSFSITDAKLCGHTVYNPTLKKCCDDELNPLPYGRPGCCKNIAFNKDNYMCCNGTVTPRPNTTKVGCCGQVGYNRDTELCCEGKIIYINVQSTMKCCGDQAYDTSSALCCNGIVRSIKYLKDKIFDSRSKQYRYNINEFGCCKTFLFYKATQDCCRGRIISREQECEELSWNVDKELCCQGIIHPRLTEYTKCCGNKSFTPTDSLDYSRFTCCNNNLLKARHNTQYDEYCCGDGLYNYWNQLCCNYQNPRWKTNPFGTDRCCGNTFLEASAPQNPYTGLCCNEEEALLSIFFGACCNGKRHFKEHDGFFPRDLDICCGNSIFDPIISICCEGKIIPLGHGSQHCCGITSYDPVRQICCDGFVHNVDPWNEYAKCCGTNHYHPANEICCDDVVFMKPYNCYHKCCGKFLIIGYNDEAEFECCQGNYFSVQDGYSCCGTHYYNTLTGMLSCCSGNVINTTTHICCNNVVNILKSENSKCCGSSSIDEALEICCGDVEKVVNTLKGQNTACCQTKSYDQLNEFCCEGVVISNPPENPQCCGTKVYDATKETCCNDVVNPLYKGTTHCCGFRSYDHSLNTCCGNNLDAPGLKCCGNAAYNNETQVCCEENVYDKNNFICCGQLYNRKSDNDKCCNRQTAYNPDTEICCGSLPHPKLGLKGEIYDCCDMKTVYNMKKQSCCENNVVSGLGACCVESDNSTYNPDTELCCRGMTRSLIPGGQCCGSDIIADTDTMKMCCKGKTVDKSSANAQCCGDHSSYNNDTHMCCAGKMVVPKLLENEQLCGCFRYNTKKQFCCNHWPLFKIFSLTEGNDCCGGKPYFTETEKCCPDKYHSDPIIAKAGYECCPTSWRTKSSMFDPVSQICCLGFVIDNPTGELDCCNGDRDFYVTSGKDLPVFNKTTQMCCDSYPVNKEDLCCWSNGNHGYLRVYPNPNLKNLKCCKGGELLLAYDDDTEYCGRTYIDYKEPSYVSDCRFKVITSPYG